MVKIMPAGVGRNERGDTLIEVVIALTILTLVLISATGVATQAFKTGQTAGERTTVSNEAQQQLEALHSFRDNHKWIEFRNGLAGQFSGIDTVLPTSCVSADLPGKFCFHMELRDTAAGGAACSGASLKCEWVPITGPMNGSVQTSQLEIWADTANPAAHDCDYDFELHYSFQTAGGGADSANHIRTRLANLKYEAPSGGAVCLP